MAKRMYDSDMRGVRKRGRLRKCWMDGVKEVVPRKSLSIEEAKVNVQVYVGACNMLLVSLQQDV